MTKASAFAGLVRQAIAQGRSADELVPLVRKLHERAQVLFEMVRVQLASDGDYRLTGLMEGGSIVLQMLGGLEEQVRSQTPSQLLSAVDFIERALRMQELILPAAQDHPPAADTAAPATRGKALLVEDEEAFLRVAGAWLRDAAFEVVEVTRADVGRGLLDQERWDLLFTDIILPGGGDGFSLASHALASNIGMAVVLSSGHAKARRPRELEGWPMLRKPFSRSDLMTAVDQALGLAAPALLGSGRR